MDATWLVFIMCVVMTFGGFGVIASFQDCFRKDSISCLQMQLFKTTRSFASNSTIELACGITLMQTDKQEAKSLHEKISEESVENAKDVLSRQQALETYLIETAERLWEKSTFTWNPAQTAKALVHAIPDTLTSQLTTFVWQGRGKEKKQMKQFQMLLPLLLAFKLKFVTLSAVALVVIAAIAKKAILAAVISLALSGFSGFKSLINPKQTVQATEMGYHHGATEWEPYTYGGRFSNYNHDDLLTSRSEPAPKQKLLNGHKAS